jgi:hypothetical protein
MRSFIGIFSLVVFWALFQVLNGLVSALQIP